MQRFLLLCVLCVPMAAWARPCLAVIGVAANGAIYEDRGGAWVRQSPKVVEEILRNGCYPEDGPSPTSSVTLVLAPGAPKARVDLVCAILARTGWPERKVKKLAWSNAPARPREF